MHFWFNPMRVALFVFCGLLSPALAGPVSKERTHRAVTPRDWESALKDVERGRSNTTDQARWSLALALGMDISTPAGKAEWQLFQNRILGFESVAVGDPKAFRTAYLKALKPGASVLESETTLSEGNKNRIAVRELLKSAREEHASNQTLKLNSGIFLAYARLVRSTESAFATKNMSPAKVLEVVKKGSEQDKKDFLVLLDTAARIAESEMLRHSVTSTVDQANAAEKAAKEAAATADAKEMESLMTKLQKLKVYIAGLDPATKQTEITKATLSWKEAQDKLDALRAKELELDSTPPTETSTARFKRIYKERQAQLSAQTTKESSDPNAPPKTVPRKAVIEAIRNEARPITSMDTALHKASIKTGKTFDEIRSLVLDERARQEQLHTFYKMNPEKLQEIQKLFLEEFDRAYTGMADLKKAVATALFGRIETFEEQKKPHLSMLLGGGSGGGKSFFPKKLAWSFIIAMRKAGIPVSLGGKTITDDPKNKGKQFIQEYSIKSEDLGHWIDGGNYQAPHEIAKLIGAPPGYVGHEKDQKPAINQERVIELTLSATHEGRTFEFNQLILDEIEKAHSSLRLAMYPLLDNGTFESYHGSRLKRVDYSKTFVVGTTNEGAEAIGKEFTNRMVELANGGFKSNIPDHMRQVDEHIKALEAQVKDFDFLPIKTKLKKGYGISPSEIQKIADAVLFRAIEEASTGGTAVFPTAFIGRWDHVVAFRTKHISEFVESAKFKILSWHEGFLNRSEKVDDTGVFIKVLGSAQLAFAHSFKADLGMRNLDKILDQRILKPVQALLLTKQIRRGETVVVRLVEGTEPSDRNFQLEFLGIDQTTPESNPQNQKLLDSASIFYGKQGEKRTVTVKPTVSAEPTWSEKMKTKVASARAWWSNAPEPLSLKPKQQAEKQTLLPEDQYLTPAEINSARITKVSPATMRTIESKETLIGKKPAP